MTDRELLVVSGRALETRMTPQEAFVAHLRRHRQRSRISLEEISAQTCIKQELLEGLERNDLSAWPRGVYARAWVRAYAAAVGLDPQETVDEFCRLFPHGDRRARKIIEEMAGIVITTSQYRDEYGQGPDRRRPEKPAPDEPPQAVSAETPPPNPFRTVWARIAAALMPQRVRRSPRATS